MNHKIIFSLLLSTSFLSAQTIMGKVVSIADGDTLTVLDNNNIQHKIRLACIDAPEKKQPFGEKSKLNLSNMIYKKTVTVDVRSNDRYGRLIGYIFKGSAIHKDSKSVNLFQIADGYAWTYKHYCDDSEFYQAQEVAQKMKIGLWESSQQVAPWDFRREQKVKNK